MANGSMALVNLANRMGNIVSVGQISNLKWTATIQENKTFNVLGRSPTARDTMFQAITDAMVDVQDRARKAAENERDENSRI